MTPPHGTDATDATVATRIAMHAIAESVLAGPQFRAAGTIRLRIADGRITTWPTAPQLGFDSLGLHDRDRTVPFAGATLRSLALTVGVPLGPPEGPYRDHVDLDPDAPLAVDPTHAHSILHALVCADVVLAGLSAGASEQDDPAVLWPEHFDIARTLDGVTYGVSPGDGFIAGPYAYVLPPEPRESAFFSAPFGAAAALPGPEEGRLGFISSFFEQGRRELAG